MMRYSIAAATSLLLAAGATAAAVRSNHACASVSDSWIEQKASSKPGDKFVASVPAALAYDCLNSVPLDEQAARELVDALEPYLQFQSDTAYKANPPPGYPFPAHDIFASLASVKGKVLSKEYRSEYAFQLDLFETVFAPGHDSQFQYVPDILSLPVAWGRTDFLVSVSDDGSSLPVIKRYEDVVEDPVKAPVIIAINGVDAASFIESVAAKGTEWSDVDAGYNSMFMQRSANSRFGIKGSFHRGGNIGLTYPGPTTSYTYDNGTTVTVNNVARLRGDWSQLRDGAAVFAMFCAPGGQHTARPAPKHPHIYDTPPLFAAKDGRFFKYPEPVIATSDLVVSGYYLNGTGLDHVAVLALSSFVGNSTAEFQSVCSRFLEMAAAAGKTKLVIDVQYNPGGIFLQAIDLLRQLIPHIHVDYNLRQKMSGGAVALARSFDERLAGIDPLAAPEKDVAWDSSLWYTNWRFGVDVHGRKFTKFEDKFSSQVIKETTYTSLYRWDLQDPLITTNKQYGVGIEITGHGTRANAGVLRFRPENIAILHDGICNGACAFFSEQLSRHGGVKTIVLGGRPKLGPMQGSGGGKGGPVIPLHTLYEAVQRAKAVAKDGEHIAALDRFSDVAFRRSTYATVNSADWILDEHIEDGVPTQYLTSHADCRLFWTVPMLRDGAEVWKAAADAAFHGAKCAYGGVKDRQTAKRASTQ
ncbi:hypothetical protein RJ55_07697 [Drechmeria coniospora]|nr:hypothetical protein RJ55_07697 [Drechmeria coniospora]